MMCVYIFFLLRENFETTRGLKNYSGLRFKLNTEPINRGSYRADSVEFKSLAFTSENDSLN